MVQRFVSVAVLVGVVGLLAVAPVASAASAVRGGQSTSCSALLGVKFSPGLTLAERDQMVQSKGRLSDCVGGGVTNGTLVARGQGRASCTSGMLNVRSRITWNTSATSEVSVMVDIATGDVTGMVTAGLFVGEPVTGNLTLTPVTGNCISSPVTRARAEGPISL